MNNKTYFGRGKLLITGEYFVSEGAQALAVPLKKKQTLEVNYLPSEDGRLYWKSFDEQSMIWINATFSLKHFTIVDGDYVEALVLQKIFLAAREQNQHFLKDTTSLKVEVSMNFSKTWGLGTSSSLLSIIAQWAKVCPFYLLKKTFGGSGYDIACATASKPILYHLKKEVPSWREVNFNPLFKNHLFLFYLGKKQNSQNSLKKFKLLKHDPSLLKKIDLLTTEFIECTVLEKFDELLGESEALISSHLGVPPIKQRRFSDFWGSIKSLGAWGGDFALATSQKKPEKTWEYFKKKGVKIFFQYEDLVL